MGRKFLPFFLIFNAIIIYLCYNRFMEKIVKEILNDEIVIKMYNLIDNEDRFSSSHGMRHIENTLKLAQKIEDLFDVPQKERTLIETSLVLHDIGQLQGRKDHGKRSKEFAKNYLPNKNYFSKEELKTIYSAIEYHDEVFDFSKLKTNVAWFVNLIDKLDFSKDRLVDNYREKFDYSVYEEVDHLDFSLNENIFNIDIKRVDGSKAEISELFERVLFSKAVLVFEKFCKKFKLEPNMKLDNKNIDLNLLNKEREMPE